MMARQSLETIILCGHGLAFETTLAALSGTLPGEITIIALELKNADNKDIFYGSVTSPRAYNFHLSIGLSEPDLIYNTDTSFAYGTNYQNWASHLDWIQSHTLPFPIWQGTPFHHYLLKQKRSLQPFLVGAVCGSKGRFAHPPSDPKVPLSRAEYSYQFRPNSITALLKKQSRPKNIIRKIGEIKQVHTEDDELTSIELSNGEHITGQLYIDTSGHKGHLMEALGNKFHKDRFLYVAESLHEGPYEGTSLRKVNGESYGWKSITTLRDKYSCLTVSHPSQKDLIVSAHEKHTAYQSFRVDTGHRPLGWFGNCVAIGHSSYIMEPLTPAPLMLLQEDIDRLLGLIPHSTDMQIERKEFNRLLRDDTQHCEIFQRAFYAIDNPPKTPYWQDITSQPTPEKLKRKLTQFTSRAYLTKFDLELFNEEDWTTLHFGMRRNCQRYTDFNDGLSDSAVSQNLDNLEKSIQSISQNVPPHDRYVGNFVRYLEKKM